MNPDWIPPAYLSPSQINSLLTCGEQYRLTRVERVPERPMWAGIGGSAVHSATELRDRQAYAGEEVMDADEAFRYFWEVHLDEVMQTRPEFDPADYYTSGRKSRAWPEKETPEWWAENGPRMVSAWTVWLEHSGLRFWEFPDANGELQPGIEVEVWAEDPEGDAVPLRSIIDRVLVDAEDVHHIVDLKTGSHTPAWPMQMALNNLGLLDTHATWAWNAGFWSGRKGFVTDWTPLERYKPAWLWEQVRKAQKIRDLQLFIPQPNNLCLSACGVRQHCVAMGGTPFFPLGATMTPNSERSLHDPAPVAEAGSGSAAEADQAGPAAEPTEAPQAPTQEEVRENSSE